MQNKKHIVLVSSVGILALISGVVIGMQVATSASGSLSTTNDLGTVVNQNLYDSKADVYINGGPANNCDSGLPDGDYYFQVTDPSGSPLLSTDDITKREVAVSGGVITGNANAGDHAYGTQTGPCSMTTIQIIPYNDTPNPAGEYKVWITPVGKYDTNLSGTFGFINNESKTDNFKVKLENAAEIHGMKFHDLNANGVKDQGEEGLAGWTIVLTLPDQSTEEVVTGQDGTYEFTNLVPGDYIVCEMILDDNDPQTPPWVQTAPAANNGCYLITLVKGDNKIDNDFGNIQTAEIHGMKFHDKDADGVKDQGEEGLEGWTIVLTLPDQSTQEDVTDQSGNYAFIGLLPGEYTVCEVILDDNNVNTPPWVQTAPTDNNGCYVITLLEGNNITDKDFGNIQTAEIHGKKFYDANANGIDDNELGIANWQIDLSGTAINNNPVSESTNTNGSGEFWFMDLLPSLPNSNSYLVQEIIPPNSTWVATTPTSVNQAVVEGQVVTGIKFGNLCLGAGGGKTLGFWSNKNGQTQMNDGGTMVPELALLSGLNLRNAAGAHFNPATYSSFRTWLLGASATNMSYMLSAQLAAMKLNVEAGFVTGSSLVYAPGLLPFAPITGLSGTGFISINNLMTAANTELGLHGTVLAGSPYRSYQEALKNALDQANNNLNFVQSTPCPVVYPV